MNNTVDYYDLFDKFHDCIENLNKDPMKLNNKKEINFFILIHHEWEMKHARMIYLFLKVF